MCLIATICAALIEVWLIAFVATLIDGLADGNRATIWQTQGASLLWAAFILMIPRPLIAFAYEALHDIVFRPTLVSRIRWAAHQQVMHQPIAWFRQQQSGLLANRVVEVGVSATSAAYAVLHTLTYVLTYFVAALVLLAGSDARLILPLLIWAAIYAGHVAYAVPRFRTRYAAFEHSKSHLMANMVDTYGNIEAMKVAQPNAEADPVIRGGLRQTWQSFVALQKFEVVINVGMVVLSNLLLVALVGYAIWLWHLGDAMLGLVAAAVALSTRMSGMADWLLDAISAIYGALGATEDALISVAAPLQAPDAPNAPALICRKAAISFANVTHHHGHGGDGVSDITLTIAPREKIGLVGPSGAGKSTLVNLLMRHDRPAAGTISIDGQDINTASYGSVARCFGAVAQDPALLHRSIRDNIRLGQTASEDEMISASRQAQAHDFITALPDSYDTIVGERGVRLSGGQRQRIALARALLRDPPILVLDEATSALDSVVEAEVLERLYAFMAQRTVIAIAHRLSTIAQMDRIVVMAHGRIVKIGTHDTLLAEGGLYTDLWAHQTGGRLGAR